MAETREAFVGIDVAKLRNAVAVADAGRDGEVRYFGNPQVSMAVRGGGTVRPGS